jgi:hypothetical protein
METNAPLAMDTRPPIGIVALAGCAELLGLSLSFFSAAAAWGDFRPVDIFVFLTGPPVMLAGVAFYRLRKWAWWLGVVGMFVLATLSCTSAIVVILDRPGSMTVWDDSLATFVWGGFPFLFYYLVRRRTRLLFGIGVAKGSP